MKFDTKFNLGDVVIAIANEQKLCFTPCAFCAGVGRITGADGSKDSCGKCYGRGNRSEWLPTQWCISDRGRTLTIGLIEAVLTSDKLTEKYMAHETGIGSGTCWNGDDLFDTVVEAERECANRNAADEQEFVRQETSGDADTESSAIEQFN